jgi:hypothetical protein
MGTAIRHACFATRVSRGDASSIPEVIAGVWRDDATCGGGHFPGISPSAAGAVARTDRPCVAAQPDACHGLRPLILGSQVQDAVEGIWWIDFE